MSIKQIISIGLLIFVSISVTIGSSFFVALLMAPILVIADYSLGQPMD